jgi:hypothetical protein
MPVTFTKVTEYEHSHSKQRYRKVSGSEAAKFDDAVRDTYESAPKVPSYGWFVPVTSTPKQEQKPKIAG